MKVLGTIVDRERGAPVAGAAVSLWCEHARRRLRLAQTESGRDGTFTLEVDAAASAALRRLEDPASATIILAAEDREARVVSKRLGDPARVEAGLDRQELALGSIARTRESVRAIAVDRLAGVSSAVRGHLDRVGISTVRQLLEPRGRAALDEARVAAGTKAKVLREARLLAAFGDSPVGELLRKAPIESSSQVGRMPRQRVREMLGGERGPLGKRIDRAVNSAINRARRIDAATSWLSLDRKRMESADGEWNRVPLLTMIEGTIKFTWPDPMPEGEPCEECASCDCLFTPLAYLHDLLMLVWETWGVTFDELASALRQPIGDLDCEALNAPIVQTRLACEVLEERLGSGTRRSNTAGALAWKESVTLLRSVLAVPAGEGPDTSVPGSLKGSNGSIAAIEWLAGRIDALAADAPERAVARTALARLEPAYRDHLVACIGQSADELERTLFIDLQRGGGVATTRLVQFILSVQAVILAVRTGEIRSLPAGSIPDALRAADAETLLDPERWRWLSSYTAWSGAMYAIAYPENVLSASTRREEATPTASVLRDDPSSSGLDPTALRDEYRLGVPETALLVGLARDGERVVAFAGGFGVLWANEASVHDLLEGGSLPPWRGWRAVPNWPVWAFPLAVTRVGIGEPRFAISMVIGGGEGGGIIGVTSGLDDCEEVGSLPSMSAADGDERRAVGVPVDHGPDGGTIVRVPAEWHGGGEWRNGAWEPLAVDFAPQVGERGGAPPTPGAPARLSTFAAVDLVQPATVAGVDTPGRAYFAYHTRDGVLVGQLVEYTSESAEGSRERIDGLAAPASVRDAAEVRWQTSDAGIPDWLLSRDVIEEYLFIHLAAAQDLTRAARYERAHHHLLRVFDPFHPSGRRHRFPFQRVFAHDPRSTWAALPDALSPDAVARRTSGAYLRHAILLMAVNLLRWAEHEHAAAGLEELNRAEELYRLARRVLDAPELDRCGALAAELATTLVETITRAMGDDVSVKERSMLRSALLEADGTQEMRLVATRVGEWVAQRRGRADRSVDAATDEIRRAMRETQRARTTFRNRAAERDEEFLLIEDAVLAADLQLIGIWGGDAEEEPGPPDPTAPIFPRHFRIPTNPLLKLLVLRTDAGLAKIRARLDVAGNPLPASESFVVGPVERSTLFSGGLGLEGGSGPILIEPPRYRYAFLVEKARQHVGLAQQLESALLSAVQARSQAQLNELLADQARELAGASRELRALGVREAALGIEIATSQRDLALEKVDWYGERSDQSMWEELSPEEVMGLTLLQVSTGLQVAAGVVSAISVAGAVIAGAAGGAGTVIGLAGGTVTAETGIGAIVGYGGGLGAAVIGASVVAAAGPIIAQSLSSFAGAASTYSGYSLTVASFQRRHEEWQLQHALAGIEKALGDLQIDGAELRREMAGVEFEIAGIHLAHADELLAFHRNRLDDAALFDWMVGELHEIYRQTLQIATATARLAEWALRFERPEMPAVIASDYWSPVASAAQSLTESQQQLGLLGAERLALDLSRLDDLKTRTDVRALQVAKTISLAAHAPFQLVELRRSGRAQLTTLMEWFDRDFPGHYLRLIKGVKVTILALVPPIDGIHGRLSVDGVSSIVVPTSIDESGRPTGFERRPAVRTIPDAIALDATANETGVFVFDYSDPMFLPFEAMGVEAAWTLELPPATNRFDFATIVDVLITIEHTARHSPEYEETVKAALGDALRADVVLDARVLAPDAWYQLANPRPGVADDLVLRVPAPRSRFPANVRPSFSETIAAPFQTRHVSIILVGTLTDADAEALVDLVSLKVDGLTVPLSALHRQAAEVTADGVHSTVVLTSRVVGGGTTPEQSPQLVVPSAGGVPAHGASPVGEWVVDCSALASEEALRAKLEDVVIIATVEGRVRW